MRNENRNLPRALGAFLAGSIVGCAPAGLITQRVQLPESNLPNFNVNPSQEGKGAVSFTIRWPSLGIRRLQAIPGSATVVVVFVWKDASKKTAVSVQTHKREDADTAFNHETGRYETSGNIFIPPGRGYVLELRAFDVDPSYQPIDKETPADALICGQGSVTPPPIAVPAIPSATSSTLATSSATSAGASTPSATASPTATTSAAATTSAPATASAPVKGLETPPSGLCVPKAKLLAGGTSSPFDILAGHTTAIRVLLKAENGPEITGLTSQYISHEGGGTVGVQGKNFGTDPKKLLVALVPAYQNTGYFPTVLEQVSELSNTGFKVKVPGKFSGTLYVYVDGIEAQPVGIKPSVQVIDAVYINSSNLKFDIPGVRHFFGGPGQQTNKIYALAGATVSLVIKGSEPFGGQGGYNYSGDVLDAPLGSLALPGDLITFTPIGDTTEKPMVDLKGTVVFKAKGAWTMGNKIGARQNVQAPLEAGDYKSKGLAFARGFFDTTNEIKALVPSRLEQFFGFGGEVGGSAVQLPKASLTTPSGLISLSWEDFNWEVSPPNVLTLSNEGRYALAESRRIDIKFKGTLKMDPSQKIENTLKAGVDLRTIPSEVFLSQNIVGATPGLTKQQMVVEVRAGNGATASTEIRNCCGPEPLKATSFDWKSTAPSLATINENGLLSSVGSATGDLSVTVGLDGFDDQTATAAVHVTNNGGLALEID